MTLTVVVGLALSGRTRIPAWPRFAVEDVRRHLGLLTGTFIGLHGLALLVDRSLPFSLAQLVIPGTSSYRPLATALGVVAAELLTALAFTNRLKPRVSYRFWRRAHNLTFAAWVLALGHGITVGTDTRSLWALRTYVVACAAVTALVVWRALRASADASSLRLWPAAAAVLGAEAVLVVAFAVH